MNSPPKVCFQRVIPLDFFRVHSALHCLSIFCAFSGRELRDPRLSSFTPPVLPMARFFLTSPRFTRFAFRAVRFWCLFDSPAELELIPQLDSPDVLSRAFSERFSLQELSNTYMTTTRGLIELLERIVSSRPQSRFSFCWVGRGPLFPLRIS